mgnify:CR=1 FL=1
MKPIERLKPEVLANLNAMAKDYPYTYEEIMDQLNTREGWTRLDYIVAMDIEHYGRVKWIGDAFYETAELKAKNLKETTTNG